METNIDDAKGEITIGIMRAEPLSGSGVIVSIIFDVDSDNPEDSSTLTFLVRFAGGVILHSSFHSRYAVTSQSLNVVRNASMGSSFGLNS